MWTGGLPFNEKCGSIEYLPEYGLCAFFSFTQHPDQTSCRPLPPGLSRLLGMPCRLLCTSSFFLEQQGACMFALMPQTVHCLCLLSKSMHIIAVCAQWQGRYVQRTSLVERHLYYLLEVDWLCNCHMDGRWHAHGLIKHE